MAIGLGEGRPVDTQAYVGPAGCANPRELSDVARAGDRSATMNLSLAPSPADAVILAAQALCAVVGRAFTRRHALATPIFTADRRSCSLPSLSPKSLGAASTVGQSEHVTPGID